MNLETFFRNPEIRRSLAIWSGMGILFTIISACMDLRFGLMTGLFSLFWIGVSLAITVKRYRALTDLSLEIDRILHGNSHFDWNQFSEGELSILSSEIYKMTIRLREQADALEKDKVWLADSLADISHQIRTPLTSINLIANFLSEENLTEERRYQLTKELFRLLSRIEWLITTLLKMSKLDAGAIQMVKEPVHALQMVQKAADLIAIPMELRNQKLVLRGTGREIFSGDMAWCVEAVGNVLKNCMEHTPEGGTLTVELRDNTLFTEIRIADTGNGFEKEDIPHLFERFYKGKNAGKDSFGIGLALSRMIVQAQDGIIQAKNGEHGGAEFVIRFYKATI